MIKALVISLILNGVLLVLLGWIYFTPVKRSEKEVKLKEKIKDREAAIEKVYADDCRCSYAGGKITFHR